MGMAGVCPLHADVYHLRAAACLHASPHAALSFIMQLLYLTWSMTCASEFT